MRKDYLKPHQLVSTATARRDLKNGVESGLLARRGDKAIAVYRFLS